MSNDSNTPRAGDRVRLLAANFFGTRLYEGLEGTVVEVDGSILTVDFGRGIGRSNVHTDRVEVVR